jgi:hypothetical protein
LKPNLKGETAMKDLKGETAMKESPTCVVEFVDGEVTRMTTWCAPSKPDRQRGINLAHHAYRSRTGREPPAIKSVHFESEGARLTPLTLVKQ